MKKFYYLAILVLIIGVAQGGQAQNLLNQPESVVFDALNNRYLVANYGDGSIVQIENDLVTQSYYKTDLGNRCLGGQIVDNIYYVTIDGIYLKGFDLSTDELVSSLLIETENVFLQGIETDSSGNLYMVDSNNGAIYQTIIGSDSYSVFVSGLGSSPQDIAFDPKNNRLLICYYSAQSIIQQIILPEGTLSLVTGTSMGYFDGLAIDHNGGVYASSNYSMGGVYHFDASFTYAPETIIYDFRSPTNLDFNSRDNILAVPSFTENRVLFIPLDDSDKDNFLDINDNCPEISNPNQENADNDRFGNICDNCPNDYNNDQADIDGDGVGDVCDNCHEISNPEQDDPDGDEIGTICDNCPNHFNKWQQDSDGDGIGNICDFVCGDFDGDEIMNILDVVYLIDSIYNDGFPPNPPDRMDVNHDRLANILDVVYILNSLYKNGPQPDCTV